MKDFFFSEKHIIIIIILAKIRLPEEHALEVTKLLPFNMGRKKKQQIYPFPLML